MTLGIDARVLLIVSATGIAYITNIQLLFFLTGQFVTYLCSKQSQKRAVSGEGCSTHECQQTSNVVKMETLYLLSKKSFGAVPKVKPRSKLAESLLRPLVIDLPKGVSKVRLFVLVWN